MKCDKYFAGNARPQVLIMSLDRGSFPLCLTEPNRTLPRCSTAWIAIWSNSVFHNRCETLGGPPRQIWSLTGFTSMSLPESCSWRWVKFPRFSSFLPLHLNRRSIVTSSDVSLFMVRRQKRLCAVNSFYVPQHHTGCGHRKSSSRGDWKLLWLWSYLRSYPRVPL